jgi:hypothetical protein
MQSLEFRDYNMSATIQGGLGWGRKNPSYLGALTFSSVKVISGALPLGVVAVPSRMTVSPLNTFLTRAIPFEGRMIGRDEGTTEAMIDATVV